MTDQSQNAMWGGRFADGPDAIMEAINASIGFDQRLAAQDIRGSRAHAAMLAAQGILTDSDAKAIREGLLTVLSEIEGGKFEFSTALEDIHMNVEARLKALIGEAAGRLHTARSRNDQVATDFRLWVRGAIDSLDDQARDLQAALLDQAEREADTVMPGYTHLQAAQPVTFGHHLLAYVEMLGRDRGRLADARRRLNESPLGAAALAGTSFPIDREETARELGDFRGRVVLVNLWATWCPPCVHEMPSLDRLQGALGGEGLAVLAVSVDRKGLAIVKPFLRDLAVRHLEPYVDPNGTLAAAFGMTAVPTSYLIDARGRLVGAMEGSAPWDSPEAKALLRHYLRKAAPADAGVLRTGG